jgi:DNA polymerase III delta subunit
MKVLVIHGDYVTKSYEKLDSVISSSRKKAWEIVRVDGSKNGEIQDSLRSNSLFNDKRLFILANVNKLTKKSLDWLFENAGKIAGYLIIYQESILGVTITKNFPKGTKIEEYSLPKLIFKFSDSFFPGNGANCLKLLHEIIKTEPVEFVFSLLAKHLRDLYWVKADPKSVSYPDWRVSKLKSQALRFTQGKLAEVINLLAEADILAKTSKADLLDSLDRIIITKLE